MEAYNELAKVFRRLHSLQHCLAMLQWDQIAMMPPQGGEARSAARAEIEVIMHNLIVEPSLKALLATATKEAAQLAWQQRANLREMQRAWDKENRLPSQLVERKALAVSRAEQAWEHLRPSNDWAGFVPYLEEIVAITREEGKLLAEGTDLCPYEALMQEFEPGMRMRKLDEVFGDVKRWLPDLLQRVVSAQKRLNILTPQGPFPLDKQKVLGRRLMECLGFNFEAGRLDVSAHPCCGGVPEDVRLTTRYREDDFCESAMGVVHETGHARYEQNLPREWIDQPVASARSMGVHESQSLFFEMQVGHSAQFVKYLKPLLEEHFSTQPAFEEGNLVQYFHRVIPGLIRVDADEVSYPLHVILRYEIEASLLDGSLQVADIPKVWREKMQYYLGVAPAEGDNKDGCMQDVHWSIGCLGYFPTYTLGAMYAAQFMAAIRRDLSDQVVNSAIESGKLEPISAWLKERVWNKGSMLPTDELIQQATGEPLNPIHFRRHLERRYLEGK